MRWLVAFAVACSGSKAPPPPTPSGPAASLTETAAHDDVQVATVNGRAVWGSCVTAQAARGATRDDALKQCIDFELMAQAADARGFASNADVVYETRTALVSQLVAHDYEDKLTKPADFGSFWTRSLERNKMRFDHPEARGSVYARIQVPRGSAPDVDQAAKQRIDKIYAAIANERGLSRPAFEELVTRANGGKTPDLKIDPVPPDQLHGGLIETYATALFAIPEVGRVSPPVRTQWGWDIILLDNIVAEYHATPDEVVAQALPEIKRAYFPVWVNEIAKSLGVHIEVFEPNMSALENL